MMGGTSGRECSVLSRTECRFLASDLFYLIMIQRPWKCRRTSATRKQTQRADLVEVFLMFVISKSTCDNERHSLVLTKDILALV